MTNTSTIPVAELPEDFTLSEGKHDKFEAGACLLEAASYMAGEMFSDHPVCVDPIIGAFGRNLNDRLPDDRRQELKPYVARMLDTANDGKQDIRKWMAFDALVREVVPSYLQLIGFKEAAATLRVLTPITSDSTRVAAKVVSEELKREMQGIAEEKRAALETILKDLMLQHFPAYADATYADDAYDAYAAYAAYAYEYAYPAAYAYAAAYPAAYDAAYAAAYAAASSKKGRAALEAVFAGASTPAAARNGIRDLARKRSTQIPGFEKWKAERKDVAIAFLGKLIDAA